jgi:1,4-dihydroxy-2-naphthoyl-CoA synthase
MTGIPEFETIAYAEADGVATVTLNRPYVAMGTHQESIAEGQQLFASGKRVEWKSR